MRAAVRAATLLTTALIAWPTVLASGTVTPGGAVTLGGAAAVAAAQPDGTVRIELDSMSPRLVTADGPGVLTVTGRVSNSSDRMVTAMDMRVQRGEPAGTEDELRAALSGAAATDTARPRFTDVPGDLPPGGSVAFRVDVALRGGGELDSLGIDAPGVYPLLVNLNGTPDDGDRARLAATRLLLPVLGLPAGAGAAPRPPVPPAARTPFTIVWPLVDRPRRLPNSPGEPPVLTDDDLAVSLAPGGRLRGLLDAVAEFAPPGSPLAPALCLAVDPE
ncbi:MAG TPA: DUF6049 family protein, partial [Pseudonocardiaceae bacterium]|nr:DUF6049 family protein [Pseudonocardiaceae bacterium]